MTLRNEVLHWVGDVASHNRLSGCRQLRDLIYRARELVRDETHPRSKADVIGAYIRHTGRPQ